MELLAQRKKLTEGHTGRIYKINTYSKIKKEIYKFTTSSYSKTHGRDLSYNI
jgi:hypothetical protein